MHVCQECVHIKSILTVNFFHQYILLVRIYNTYLHWADVFLITLAILHAENNGMIGQEVIYFEGTWSAIIVIMQCLSVVIMCNILDGGTLYHAFASEPMDYSVQDSFNNLQTHPLMRDMCLLVLTSEWKMINI